MASDNRPYETVAGLKGEEMSRITTSLKSENFTENHVKHFFQKTHRFELNSYVRDSTKGRLEVDILTRRVWVWLDDQESVRQWHLIVRREVGAKETIKYSLSNAPAETTVDRLAYMQGQRYFVERSFQDAKSTAGMDHYQTRGWKAWHHHMAMVMMATLFMLETRLAHKESHPLLSCPDIVSLLAHFLPRRDITPEEVLRQMTVRHRQRQASIDSAYAKQGLANVTK
jgi:hypothetical protein